MSKRKIHLLTSKTTDLKIVTTNFTLEAGGVIEMVNGIELNMSPELLPSYRSLLPLLFIVLNVITLNYLGKNKHNVNLHQFSETNGKKGENQSFY